jgi:hypothetical protein
MSNPSTQPTGVLLELIAEAERLALHNLMNADGTIRPTSEDEARMLANHVAHTTVPSQHYALQRLLEESPWLATIPPQFVSGETPQVEPGEKYALLRAHLYSVLFNHVMNVAHGHKLGPRLIRFRISPDVITLQQNIPAAIHPLSYEQSRPL